MLSFSGGFFYQIALGDYVAMASVSQPYADREEVRSKVNMSE